MLATTGLEHDGNPFITEELYHFSITTKLG
jgi:hypothetical protein